MRNLFKLALALGFLTSSQANPELLMICSHQTPHGSRHVRTTVQVFGDLDYSSELLRNNRTITISQGKEYFLKEHVYHYKRTFLDADEQDMGTSFLMTESFGKSYLRIHKKPLETQDGFGQEIPVDKLQYKGELVLFKKDGDKASGKTVEHNLNARMLSENGSLETLECSRVSPKVNMTPTKPVQNSLDTGKVQRKSFQDLHQQ